MLVKDGRSELGGYWDDRKEGIIYIITGSRVEKSIFEEGDLVD